MVHLNMELQKLENGLQTLEGLPSIVLQAGESTSKRFLEFFVANIRNPHTRQAYARAVWQFFSWCEVRGLRLETIEPMVVSAYIESHTGSKPTVKQHLAAIRMLFDWWVRHGEVKVNPASSVRGPKYVIKQGKTPVLSAEEARQLFEAINTDELIGLRDRAFIGVMVYSFARVGAVLSMKVEEYYSLGKRSFLRLHEKGGKEHQVPAHHKVEEYLDAYLEKAGILNSKKAPLFQTFNRKRELSGKAMYTRDAERMVKRRALEAGVSHLISPHTFRATGITEYLRNGGTLEKAQQIAAHESPRTTKLYDRTTDEVTLDEIERILI
jgi:integrase/recombinase XerD